MDQFIAYHSSQKSLDKFNYSHSLTLPKFFIFGNKNALENRNNWTFISSLFYNKIEIIHPNSLLCLKFLFYLTGKILCIKWAKFESFRSCRSWIIGFGFFILWLVGIFSSQNTPNFVCKLLPITYYYWNQTKKFGIFHPLPPSF